MGQKSELLNSMASRLASMAGQIGMVEQIGWAPSGCRCSFACSMPHLLTSDRGLRELPAAPHTILGFSTALWCTMYFVSHPLARVLADLQQHVGCASGGHMAGMVAPNPACTQSLSWEGLLAASCNTCIFQSCIMARMSFTLGIFKA